MSITATGAALAAPPDSRDVLLIKRDSPDCSNTDIDFRDPNVGGEVTVDRGVDGNTHVRAHLKAVPGTTYHFFLKCVRLLGDITTLDDGFGIGNFDFPSNSVGDVFAFDMSPDGAPSGNKFQSAQVNFGQSQTPNSWEAGTPADQQISRQALILPQGSSDCSNRDVASRGVSIAGGFSTIDRSADGNTHVRVRLIAQPNTTYHFFMKCGDLLGDLQTQADRGGIANFDFPTNSAGDILTFEAYPDGTPRDNFESVQIVFGELLPSLVFASQTAARINVDYSHMPPDAEIVLVDRNSGNVITSASARLGSGAGSAGIDITSAAAGSYYVMARNLVDRHYLAQTIGFFIN